MGIFKKLFSRKDAASYDELEVAAATKPGCLGEAEQIANVVAAGVENENYSSMKKQLAAIAQREEKKEAYVFGAPGVIGEYCAIVICSLLSAAFAYYLLLGIGTALLSTEPSATAVGFLVVPCAVLFVNIRLIAKFVSNVRFKVRYGAYEELLGCKKLGLVEDLAACSNQKECVVVEDLQKAISQKLIPQGHFSRDSLVFMVSDEAFGRYMEKPAAYDRYFQKLVAERRRIESRTEEISRILEEGNRYIEKMRGYEALVGDKSVAKKIKKMESVASMIFHEIDVNPNHVQSLGVFLNYYLPTTEKLLDAYVTLSEKKASGKGVAQAKKQIEEVIDVIVTAFEGILEKLYREYEMDVASEIEAMELLMKQEGFLA